MSTYLISSANLEATVIAETSYFSNSSRRFDLAQRHANAIPREAPRRTLGVSQLHYREYYFDNFDNFLIFLQTLLIIIMAGFISSVNYQ